MSIAEFFPPSNMGRPRKWEIWQIISAILHVNRMGCHWRMIAQNCVIAGIIRHGEILMPRGVTALDEAAEILALVDENSRIGLSKLLGRPAEI